LTAVRSFRHTWVMSSPSVSRQRLSRLAPLHEIEAAVDAIVRPVALRAIDVAAAAGRVLAADATVPAPVPLAAIALRDGWAVRSELVADAGPYAPALLSPIPARVDVGDPLPHDCDAVLSADAVTVTGTTAEAIASAAPGDGVLAAAGDAEPGRPLRTTGQRLRPIEVAALRAAGIAQVHIRAPRVHLYSANPTIDAIDDTVAPLLACCITSEGGVASIERAAPDGGRSLTDMLRHTDSDAIVVIGGTGSGRHDASVTTLAGIGHVDIHGMGIRPGETAALGTVASRPVLLLPGRLDGALAVWLLVGRRLMAGLSGLRESAPAAKVALMRKVVSTIGLAEVVPVAACAGGVEPLAAASLPLWSLTSAVGWILVPPHSEGFAPGSDVELRSFA
jgi:molybdopterin molybdotransferase